MYQSGSRMACTRPFFARASDTSKCSLRGLKGGPDLPQSPQNISSQFTAGRNRDRDNEDRRMEDTDRVWAMRKLQNTEAELQVSTQIGHNADMPKNAVQSGRLK